MDLKGAWLVDVRRVTHQTWQYTLPSFYPAQYRRGMPLLIVLPEDRTPVRTMSGSHPMGIGRTFTSEPSNVDKAQSEVPYTALG
jgi:hypothetical protein